MTRERSAVPSHCTSRASPGYIVKEVSPSICSEAFGSSTTSPEPVLCSQAYQPEPRVAQAAKVWVKPDWKANSWRRAAAASAWFEERGSRTTEEPPSEVAAMAAASPA